MLTVNNHKTVILVSHPGISHNVLLNLPRSLPGTNVIATEGLLFALEFIENEGVDAVIIDSNISTDDKIMLLKKIKGNYEHIQWFVLTTTMRNHKTLCASGADRVFLQQTSLKELEQVIFA